MAAAPSATGNALRLATLALLSISLAPPAAADTGSGCVADIARANRDLRSFTARMRQTKRLALLEEPLVSAGRVAFERPDRVAWEVDGETPMRVVFDGDRASVPGTTGDRPDAVPIPPSSLVRRLGALFTGDLETLGDGFEVTATCGERTASVSLTPRAPELAMAVSSLDMELAGAHLFVHRIRLTNGVGDSLEIELTEVERNVAIPAAAFSSDGGGR